MTAVRLRPARLDELEELALVAERAFALPLGEGLRRHLRHRLATDPDGCAVAEVAGAVAGVALALRRGDVWVLSLLVVDPEHQSAGVGARLLERALGYGADAPVGLIAASDDPRALRRYGRAGFALHPAVRASGPIDRRALPGGLGVRTGEARTDLERLAPVDLVVRGAARTGDLAALLEEPAARLLVADRPGRRGYAIVSGGDVATMAATDAGTAHELLLAALAEVPIGANAGIERITAEQSWAVDAALLAGLRLTPGEPVFVRGRASVPAPFLASGMYL